ncbi:MAG: polymer-forming cytoskeletal protein [Acidobacteria bacterium]|nr:polymer-forming cytoskeletal protein [Acidobacteriota bacterium]
MARDPSRDARRGYVGSGCRLTGRLNAPGPFTIRGEFVGEILSEDEVSVGNSGNFDGRIFAERVIVEDGGCVRGAIDAQAVIVRARGSIVGVAVRAASLTLEASSDADGAHFQIHRDFQRTRTEAAGASRAAGATA